MWLWCACFALPQLSQECPKHVVSKTIQPTPAAVRYGMGDLGVARGQKVIFECWNLIEFQSDQFQHEL
jgi:hypothetical protein